MTKILNFFNYQEYDYLMNYRSGFSPALIIFVLFNNANTRFVN
jgi:hypothetical protein